MPATAGRAPPGVSRQSTAAASSDHRQLPCRDVAAGAGSDTQRCSVQAPAAVAAGRATAATTPGRTDRDRARMGDARGRARGRVGRAGRRQSIPGPADPRQRVRFTVRRASCQATRCSTRACQTTSTAKVGSSASPPVRRRPRRCGRPRPASSATPGTTVAGADARCGCETALRHRGEPCARPPAARNGRSRGLSRVDVEAPVVQRERRRVVRGARRSALRERGRAGRAGGGRGDDGCRRTRRSRRRPFRGAQIDRRFLEPGLDRGQPGGVQPAPVVRASAKFHGSCHPWKCSR